MNYYIYKYLKLNEYIHFFFCKNTEKYFNLSKNYQIRKQLKNINIIYIEIEYNYNSNINSRIFNKILAQDIIYKINDYLSYKIILNIELEIELDNYFHPYMKWKFINFIHNDETNVNNEKKIYMDILKYRNNINRKQNNSLNKFIYIHSVEKEFLSLIADLDNFSFIVKKNDIKI